MSDPYDWPFPSRKDLMYLSSINKRDVGTVRPDKLTGQDFNLQTKDIDGAQPCMKPYKFTNKPDFTNTTNDIVGTRSKVLIPQIGRDGFSLNNRDIKGAYPQLNKFQTTRPPTNPVDPVYVLPKAVPVEPLQPKFIRDQINIDDIPGTKPNPPAAKLRKTVHIFDEVDGAKSKPAFMPRDHMEIMDVKDINEYRVFKSSRITNPLEPEYQLKDVEGQPANLKYGFVNGSKSRVLHPQMNFNTKNLETTDIEGCHVGAISDHFLMKQKRSQFRAINDTKDVPGAQVGTLRKGLLNHRGTNPLTPEYQLLGRNEIYNPNIPRTAFEGNRQNQGVDKPKTQQSLRSNSLNKIEQPLSTAQKFDQFIKK
ncbi:unnamed protein product [Paramecium sonneborni]|uniref:Uncharacterized protein n=1 Tax=Paramecium sonneborni TaxID=65129 RepID=A0A8S1KLL9_9CILI|nr:unnamed protein product [Paramecium sonneborni]